MSNKIGRRRFLKVAGTMTAMAAAPFSLVEVIWGAAKSENFTFAYISDSHL